MSGAAGMLKRTGTRFVLRGGLDPLPAQPIVDGQAIALAELDRLRTKLLASTCSIWWAEERIRRGSAVYPPRDGRGKPLMKWCRHCRRWMPANYVGSRACCYDCYIGGMVETGRWIYLPGSSTALAMRQIAAGRIRLVQRRLSG